MICDVDIKYVPAYADKHDYIVANYVDGELCFWSAWDDAEKAQQSADERGGIVFKKVR